MKHKLNFNTSYNQFYLCDQSSSLNTDSDNFWTTDAFNTRLAIEDRVLGIGIECYGYVNGELEILDNECQLINIEQYDHIVEGGLEVKSGLLQVLDCPNAEVELEVAIKPGNYRVRVYSSNLKNTDIDETEGTDTYKIEIWPSNDMERKVLKQYIRSIKNQC